MIKEQHIRYWRIDSGADYHELNAL
ncbi:MULTISPECIES: hypothetical protein [Enterococcus]|nr:hypothetical protein [Enterococcus avium]